MTLASTSVLVIEGATKNATGNVYVPRGNPSCLLPLQEALQDHQVRLAQASFKLLALCLCLEHERFLHDLRSFGVPVYDFDVPGELTMDKALYKDPYHADEEVKAKVVDIVWGEGL